MEDEQSAGKSNLICNEKGTKRPKSSKGSQLAENTGSNLQGDAGSGSTGAMIEEESLDLGAVGGKDKS